MNTKEGTIYIGMKDSGDIIGVSNTDKDLQEIADIITTQILPNPQDLVEIGTKYIDGKSVLEVKVKKGKALYYIKKYGRQVYTFGTSFIQCVIPYNILDKAKHEKLIGTDKENEGASSKTEDVNSKNESVKLTLTQRAVLDLLKATSQIKVAEIAKQTGKTTRTVHRTLAELKEIGCIERVGSDKTGYWKVLK